jgi:NurA-like 5'-3' nuclease
MLDSLYEKALKKKDEITERIENEFGDMKIDPSEWWIKTPINENDQDLTISGGDGSFNQKKFLSFIYYAVDAECLIYNKQGLKKIEISETDIIPPHRYVRDRLRNYMGIFEIKNALKAFKQFKVDLFLFDGSILGNLIRPFPLENELQSEIKEEIKSKYYPELEKAMINVEVEITSSGMLNLIQEDFKDKKMESMIYLENLEHLLSISKFLGQKKGVVGISKTSTRSDYFGHEIPDMAIFDRFNKQQGYSKPKYLKVSKEVKRDFPILKDFFRNLTFTIFYARLEDYKNILKFELPYRASEDDIINILEIIKGNSTEGYPYLLKKAHRDVIIRQMDLERLSKIIGFLEKSGREML